eukprot:4202828-Alexandrium_andersonii.AAC.1
MSASLVGSEMCIRDSLWVGRPCPCPSSPSARRPQGSYPQLRPLAGRCAVSYTHLTLPTICSV